MLFSYQRSIYEFELLIDIDQISDENVGKFLGVFVGSKLDLSVHINHVTDKVFISRGILYKLKQYLPKSSLISLYYSFFYPYFLYCNLAWANTHGFYQYNKK